MLCDPQAVLNREVAHIVEGVSEQDRDGSECLRLKLLLAPLRQRGAQKRGRRLTRAVQVLHTQSLGCFAGHFGIISRGSFGHIHRAGVLASPSKEASPSLDFSEET